MNAQTVLPTVVINEILISHRGVLRFPDLENEDVDLPVIILNITVKGLNPGESMLWFE